MAKLTISIELSLSEVRNLWYLIQNTEQLIRCIRKDENTNILNWVNSQELNLARLKVLADRIEPIAER